MADGPGISDFSARQFRDALGCFATGIAVVTSHPAGADPLGVTVNSFASVSLDPPLVSFCLDRSASSFAGLIGTPAFAVNVLRDDQQAISAAFARSTGDDKFVGIEHRAGTTGSPVIEGCLCTLECERMETIDAGDHVILLGRVVNIAPGSAGRPLLYFRGRYARLEPPPAA